MVFFKLRMPLGAGQFIHFIDVYCIASYLLYLFQTTPGPSYPQMCASQFPCWHRDVKVAGLKAPPSDSLAPIPIFVFA